jgi:6-phosphogluconolactonase (cycloisomerase 2 family)
MRARTISALCGLIGIFAVCVAGFLSGCASSKNQFAYVVGQGTNEVFEFRVNGNGTLTPLGTPNFAVGSNPSAVVAQSSGNFLYVAAFAGNDVTLLVINNNNGNLSVPVSNSIVVPVNPPNIFNTGTGPISMAVSPTAPFLYVANQTSGNITAFTIDPGSGSLGAVAGSPFPITPVSHPQSLAISPKGDFLFVANPGEATVAVFAIANNGVLTAVAGSPFAMGVGATPNAVVAGRNGSFLYVADTAHNVVLGFAVQSNGTLSPINGSPFAAGAQPIGLGIDPQGAFLYAANTASNNVSAYVIDAASGALGPVNGSPFATGGLGASSVAVNATTTAVYVTNQVSHDVAAFAISSSGVLTPLVGSPFTVATSASAVSVVVTQ